MRNYRIYLQDIIDAMNAIEDFVKGMSFEDFRKNDMVNSAIIRKFEIIGEAANQLPAEIKKKHKDVPWAEMKGMRNKLIHNYFGINYSLVWETINTTLPQVRENIRHILKEVK